ncbi:hypothetical protein NLI96_g821 [Meripilus lineatus]|uniref:Uncharacterized protein n=1 Tax=Meripilus lineatus TaxID=2056292 RepID=A0AAD5VD38_9APHY|nr:hypothetical protein NLI96_g821 [Physisporinus lineatus]
MSSPGIIHNVIIPTVAPESCPPIPVLTYAVRQILCLASFMSFREEIFSLLCTIDATTSHLKRNVERLLHVGDSRLSNDTSQDPSERSRETTARAILRVIERAQEVLVAVLCNISQYDIYSLLSSSEASSDPDSKSSLVQEVRKRLNIYFGTVNERQLTDGLTGGERETHSLFLRYRESKGQTQHLANAAKTSASLVISAAKYSENTHQGLDPSKSTLQDFLASPVSSDDLRTSLEKYLALCEKVSDEVKSLDGVAGVQVV